MAGVQGAGAATVHRLLALKDIDKQDELEQNWEEAYRRLLEKMQGKSESEVNGLIMKDASEAPLDLTNALMFGVLTNKSPGADRFVQMMIHSTKDKYVGCLNGLKKVVYEKYLKLTDIAREQLLWLAAGLIRLKVADVDGVFLGLLRQVVVGSLAPKNVWLTQQLVDTFLSYRDWLFEQPTFLPYVLYALLSVLNDHIRNDALKDRIVALAVQILRERFETVKVLGRDLIRLLMGTSRLPEIEAVFRDVLGSIVQVPVVGQVAPTGPQTNLRNLCHTHTPRQYLQSRISPEMEQWLLFIMQSVKMGNQKRYQQWFANKYLTAPESETLVPEIIRYICGVFHPSNEILRSEITQRWAVIGWLMHLPKAPHAIANSKLALFIDWFFYIPKLDSIMLIEPAILLMYHSVPRYVEITASLIEFLIQSTDTFFSNPSNKEDVKRGVQNSMRTILEKKVISSLEPISSCPLIDKGLRDLIRKTFEPFLGPDSQRLHDGVMSPDKPLRKSGNALPAPMSLSGSGSGFPPPAAPAPSEEALPNVFTAKPPPPPAELKPASLTAEVPPSQPKVPAKPPAAVAQLVSPVKSLSPPAPNGQSASAAASAPAPASHVGGDDDMILEQWNTAVKTTPRPAKITPSLPGPTQAQAAVSDSPTEAEVSNFKKEVLAAPLTNPIDTVASDAKSASVFQQLTLFATLRHSVMQENRPVAKKVLLRILDMASNILTHSTDDTSTSAFSKRLAVCVVDALHPELLAPARPSNLLFTSPPRTLSASGSSYMDLSKAAAPVHYVIFRQYCGTASNTSILPILASLRQSEDSFGWRLLAYLMRKQNLIVSIPEPAPELRKKESPYESILQSLNVNSKSMPSYFDPYVKLLKEISPKESQELFVQDCQFCVEANVEVFFEMLPMILLHLPKLSVGNEKLIHLVCNFVYPSQLHQLCCQLAASKIELIAGALVPVSTASLNWDAMAQQCFWQLLNAEFGVAGRKDNADAETFLSSFLPTLNFSQHESALSGACTLLRTLPPSAELVPMLFQLPLVAYQSLIALFTHWESTTLPPENDSQSDDGGLANLLADEITDLIGELCKKSRTDAKKNQAKLFLEHISLWHTSNPQSPTFEKPGPKILQLINNFNFQADFPKLVDSFKRTDPPKPAATRGAKAGAAKSRGSRGGRRGPGRPPKAKQEEESGTESDSNENNSNDSEEEKEDNSTSSEEAPPSRPSRKRKLEPNAETKTSRAKKRKTGE